MASWVRPGCLGSLSEFGTRYEQPITHGMAKDSSKREVANQVRATRSLVHKMAPFMQRKTNKILAKDLPPLQQVIMFVRQSKLQARLYAGFKKHLKRLERQGFKMGMIQHYHEMRPINNHPACALPDHRAGFHPTDSQLEMGDKPTVLPDWKKPLLNCQNPDGFEHGFKIYLMLQIIFHATEVRDKVVVFSQCLRTLDFIEKVLMSDWGKHIVSNERRASNYRYWKKNVDYFRIDGAMGATGRGESIEAFKCAQSKVFLISILAGGIG